MSLSQFPGQSSLAQSSGALGLDALPDEMLVEICWKMDIQTLIRTAKTSSRIHGVCSDVLEDREDEIKYAKSLKFVKDRLIKGKVSAVKMLSGGSFVNIDIKKVEGLDFLRQVIEGVARGKRNRYPWPLITVDPTIEFSSSYFERRSSYFQMTSELDHLAEYLVRGQYKIV